MSPTSSRNRLPPSACSNLPVIRLSAPTKAPFSWPNSSDSTRSRGIAAILIGTKGPARRDPRSCSARATSSLPVPLSPVISTVRSVLTTRAMALNISCIGRERPTRGPPSSNPVWVAAAGRDCPIELTARLVASTRRQAVL